MKIVINQRGLTKKKPLFFFTSSQSFRAETKAVYLITRLIYFIHCIHTVMKNSLNGFSTGTQRLVNRSYLFSYCSLPMPVTMSLSVSKVLCSTDVILIAGLLPEFMSSSENNIHKIKLSRISPGNCKKTHISWQKAAAPHAKKEAEFVMVIEGYHLAFKMNCCPLNKGKDLFLE